MKKFLFSILIILTIVILFSFSIEEARADTGVLQSCGYGPPQSMGTMGEMQFVSGYKFTANTEGKVTELCGYFYDTRLIKLYSSSYSVLTSAQVYSNGHWVCVSIDPGVDLVAGSSYYIVVEMPSNAWKHVYTDINFDNCSNSITINAGVIQIRGFTFNDNHTEQTNSTYGLADIVFSPPISPPTVITKLATVNLEDGTATLIGDVTATGWENVGERGFEWGMTPGSYPNSWTETGSFVAGTFSLQKQLTPGTIYYYRAKAYNTAGWGYGVEKRVVIYAEEGEQMSFTTLPENDPPTANAGRDKQLSQDESIVLQGSSSDPDGDPMSFSWSCCETVNQCYCDEDGDGHYSDTPVTLCDSCTDFDCQTTPGDDCDDSCVICYPDSTYYTDSPDERDQDCDGVVDNIEYIISYKRNWGFNENCDWVAASPYQYRSGTLTIELCNQWCGKNETCYQGSCEVRERNDLQDYGSGMQCEGFIFFQSRVSSSGYYHTVCYCNEVQEKRYH